MSDDAPDPYAPPKVVEAQAAPLSTAGALAIDVDRKIPRCCLKCAATKKVIRREEQFAVTSPAGRGLSYGGGAVGAAVAAAARHDSSLLVPLILGVVVVGGVLGWILHTSATRVHLSLPLCAPCDHRWTQGVAIRRAVVTMLAAIGAGAILGLAVHSKSLLIGLGVAFVVVLVVAIVAKLPQRFVGVLRLDGRFATLTNVSPEAIALIEKGLPKKQR